MFAYLWMCSLRDSQMRSNVINSSSKRVCSLVDIISTALARALAQPLASVKRAPSAEDWVQVSSLQCNGAIYAIHTHNLQINKF